MSTFDPILGITRDDGKAKPTIIKFYDHTKGGTDILDQISERITVKPKSVGLYPGIRECWILLLWLL